MKVCVNGKIRDMSQDEIAQIEASRKQAEAEMPKSEPTPEERIAELEAALELLLSGVTE